MQERKPTGRLHYTVHRELTLELTDLRPGASVTLRVVESGRRKNRKRRVGRNHVVIERSDGVAVTVTKPV